MKNISIYSAFLVRVILTFLSMLLINFTSNAENRYVSKNGTSVPPYTSWETAADSIMKCVNICQFGDTIYVGNGEYKEKVVMIPGLALIGAGMDSCIINPSELPLPFAVTMSDTCLLKGFQFRLTNNSGTGIYVYHSTIHELNVIVENNKVLNANYGIDIGSSSLSIDHDRKIISKNILLNVKQGIVSASSKPFISENLINARENALYSQVISSPTYLNNMVVFDQKGYCFGFRDFGNTSILKNNLFVMLEGKSGQYGMYSYGDTLINNVVFGNFQAGILTSGSVIRNNSISNSGDGIWYDIGGGSPPVVQYNNLWQNGRNYRNINPDSTNISYDPMFVNPDSLDFHLQMFSPIIDAGDPSILDKDGSRSDIGLFGGPYGETYTYQDLAPRPPSNLTASYDSGFVLLRWDKNTEADFFHYRIYRDTLPDFMYDTTRLIGITADSFYYDDLPEKYIAMNYYYKITAIDSTGHQSAPSEEVHLNITGAAEGPPVVVEHYQLLNNYPNPFNSSTMIPYRLKEPGYVKLYIYDIKGEVVSLLINEYQQAGYYEVRFNPTEKQRKQGATGEGWWTGYNNDIATGIYLFQIMVRGEGNIPVFTDMGKMILLK